MYFDLDLTRRPFVTGEVALSAKVILHDLDRHYYLQRRDPNEPFNGGKLGAFGGGYDPCRKVCVAAERTPAAVAVNEVWEETGVLLDPASLIPLHACRELKRKLDGTCRPRIVCYFLGFNLGATLDPAACMEGTIARFADAAAIIGDPDVGGNLRHAASVAMRLGCQPTRRLKTPKGNRHRHRVDVQTPDSRQPLRQLLAPAIA